MQLLIVVDIDVDVFNQIIGIGIRLRERIYEPNYNVVDKIMKLYEDCVNNLGTIYLYDINDIGYYFHVKNHINILKKILKNKRNFNKEVLSIEAYKPFRLINRLNIYGNDYEFK